MLSHRLTVGVTATLFLVGAFVFLAQAAPASHAEGTTEDVDDIDLAKMTLPLSAYGPNYADFNPSADYGFLYGNGFLGGSDSTGLRNAYRLAFSTVDGETSTAAFSGVFLYGSEAEAELSVSKTIAEAEVRYGDQYETFEVDLLPGAMGFRLPFVSSSGNAGTTTGVLSQQGHLVANVVFLRHDDIYVQLDATNAAIALSERIKGVLTGEITDFPAPLPPDVNCNGDVNSIDAALVLQLEADLVSSLPCDALADANRSGASNAVDAALILQYSAGLIERF